MKITDDTLSAFLDQELTPQEMDAVRNAIAHDEELGERLTALASADTAVKQHAAAIDCIPVPAAITELLRENTDNVVSLSAWQRGKKLVTEHMAIAASLTLALGITFGYFGSETQNTQATAGQVFASLDTTPSGQSAVLDDSTSVMPRFSFINRSGQACRQYQLQTSIAVTENIACHTGEDWQLISSADSTVFSDDNVYQPATAASLLDSTLDALMDGSPLSLEQESAIMDRNWITTE